MLEFFTNSIDSVLDLIRSFFVALLDFVLFYIPSSAGLPDVIHEGAQWFGTHLAVLNTILPMYDFYVIIFAIFSIKVTIFSVRIILTLINWIRGSGEIEI